ncbi:MAG: CotH kinase family protein, partial [Clostridia bacterium]|nr:CotH kinase family protein [Clostridia bacterium]
MKKLMVFCFALALIFGCSGCVANPTDENVSTESIGALTESGDLSYSDNSTDLTNSDDLPDATNSNDSASSENSLSSTKSDISTEPDNSTDSNKTDGSGDSDDSTTNNSSSKLCFHSYKKATCVAPKTCTKCGKTSGKALGHTYSDATCVAPKTCIKCGKTSGKALGHTYSDATCDAPKTCSVCGGTTGSALGHKYITGECVRVVNGKECGHYSETYCPKLYLSGDMSKITDPAQTSKKIECNIDYEYRSSDDNFNGAATIKIQGSSSTKYAKKNYTINFYEDSSYSSKMKIDVGFGAQSKYCLKANWVDKTHSRNVVTAKLAGEMQAKYGLFESAPNNGAIDGFPVEVYINGEFHGLYTMNIPKDEWMFNMD